MKNKIIKDEVVYAGRVVTAHRIMLQMDNGKVIPRDFLEMAQAVVVIPVLDDGTIVLIRNQRYAVREEMYEFCAGRLDSPDEEPASAAARELLEETGCKAVHMEKLGSFHTMPGCCNEYMHAFLATGISEGRQELEEYERIEVEKVSLERLKELILSGQLHDGKSIAAFGLWRLRKGV
jgi:ADP-ribose pyrophosphatase